MSKSGYTLIELSVAMAIAATLGVTQMQSKQIESSQEKARSTGKEMFQYNMALSNFLVANKDDGASVAGSYIGSDWLKDSTCSGGTSTDSYLPCAYLPDNKTIVNRIAPSTTITVEADGSLQGRTVWSPIIGDSGSPDGTTMGIASMVASGAYISQMDQENSGSQGPTVFCPDITSYSASIDAICGTDKNRIVSISSSLSTATGGGTSEEMLRTDHGNTMKSAIEFDNGSGVPMNETGVNSLANYDNRTLRQIANVARIYNIGSGSDPLILGRASGSNIYSDSDLLSAGLLDSASVLLDGNVGIKGDAYMTGDLSVKGGIKSILNIETNNRLIGNIVEANKVEADTVSGEHGLFDFQVRTDRVYTDLLNVSGLTRVGTLYTGTISASGTITSPRVSADTLNADLLVADEAHLGSTRIGDGYVTSTTYNGAANSYTYLTPDGDSKIKNLEIKGTLEVVYPIQGGGATPMPGTACTRRQFTSDNYGSMLVCGLDGTWGASGIDTRVREATSFTNGSTIMCAKGESIIGGGGQCASPDISWLHDSRPVINGTSYSDLEGWFADCHAKDGTDYGTKAYAICSRKGRYY